MACKEEFLNVEQARESVKVQGFLTLSLVAILTSGILFGSANMNQGLRDSLSSWLLTIQIVGSYYYFYQVALILSGRRSSSAKSNPSAQPSATAVSVSKQPRKLLIRLFELNCQ